MSARDKLHARLYKGPNENRDDLLDEYKAQILHEAAERVRASAGVEWEGMSDEARRIRQTRIACAALVESEVAKS
ncbi:hypothetical protein OHA79_09440 [Streptomyces sp. NBC_00841]|uniref:hypothetical protein n=1 Tax=Streptomyces sp. NBC_00841 TaxID=2975847 RepID=UPI002DDBFE6B|nr:hypothetical protein [Streptomyces sp. NBC_00841]WRZ98037.1 hypothetical protein OHA79_09440 [Streptomyces sp. NBC_00841]